MCVTEEACIGKMWNTDVKLDTQTQTKPRPLLHSTAQLLTLFLLSCASLHGRAVFIVFMRNSLRLYVLHNPPKPIRIKSTVTHSAIIAVFITLGCIFTGNTHSRYYILDRFITSAWTFRCRLLWCYCAFNVHSFFLKHSSITWRNSWSWLRWTCACGRCQIWFKKIMVSKTIHRVT